MHTHSLGDWILPGVSDATRNTQRKSRSTPPLVAALNKYWGRVEFVAISIGHADTTLTRTLDHLSDAFSTVRPRMKHANANKGTPLPTMDSNATSHDYRRFKSMLDSLADLAQSRLLGIIRNMARLVDALPRAVMRNRANSDATLTHTHAVSTHGSVTHTHKTRTTRVPESTAITRNGGDAAG